MEIDLHWEVDPVLDLPDLNLLSETVQNLNKLTEKFDFLLKQKPAGVCCLNIIITDDLEIKSINKQYRNKNAATDVLTFPFDQSSEKNTHEEFPNYAEIYISQDTAIRQSEKHNLTLLNEFIILIVHGLLHAFHYDHETSEKEKIKMRSYEKDVLTYLGVNSVSPLTTPGN